MTTSSNENLGPLLRQFSEKVRDEIPALLRRYQAARDDGSICYVDQPGQPRRVRPWCDAMEIAAAFGFIPDSMSKAEWIANLRSFQEPKSGRVPEHISDDAHLDPAPNEDPVYDDLYPTMIVNYALECVGSHLEVPVAVAENITAEKLDSVLDALPWKRSAWGVGGWIDVYATCLHANRDNFGLGLQAEHLIQWLSNHCDPQSGVWGTPREEDRWLQPVNGFYRLTRGTYAQFARPLPYPEQAMKTILHHSGDSEFFGDGRGHACNVLDVVHPFWLCLRQTDLHRAEVLDWVRTRLPATLDNWVPGQGMAFDPRGTDRSGEPGLQGTEMWLSIIYYMADLLGLKEHLVYSPKGVHEDW